MLKHLYSLTKSQNLCIGGGVGLNALANGKIYEKTPFKNIYIFGPAGDSGGALGAAFFIYHNLSIKPPRRWPKDSSEVKSLSLGSSFTNNEIERVLKQYKVRYQKFANEDKLLHTVSSLLNKGHIIGWFQGRMEFGPRALGNRSILAKPNPFSMKDKVNKIKIRELFRPFAGSILQEKVHEYFDVPQKNYFSPFMTFCFKVKKQKSDDLAAIVHKDGTCRIQTVNKENDRFYRLIKKFYEQTNIPCILNTSFNLKGEPIVENLEQAVEDFLKTKMDYLCIENFLVFKVSRME
jgi:carbamoyltransferase